MKAGLTISGWQAWRETVSYEADASKSSHDALAAMLEAYRRLDQVDRAVVDDWMAVAVQGVDESARFDAIAMIREFRVKSLAPELRVLADKLASDGSPSAPYEWAKVNRLLGVLGEDA